MTVATRVERLAKLYWTAVLGPSPILEAALREPYVAALRASAVALGLTWESVTACADRLAVQWITERRKRLDTSSRAGQDQAVRT